MEENQIEVVAKKDKDKEKSAKKAFIQSDVTRNQIGMVWKDIHVTFPDGTEGLKGVSGSISPGELIGFLGHSGAGKTTLLNILNGRLAHSQGQIFVNGEEFDPKNWGTRACFVEQFDAVIATATPKEVFQFAANLRLQTSSEKKEELVQQLIKQLRLERCKDTLCGDHKFIKGISGGELKRVCIGRELICDCSLIFMDEPLSGLDSCTATELMEILTDLCTNYGISVLMTVHQPASTILKMFDRFMFFHEGQMLATGDEQEIKSFVDKMGSPCPQDILITDHIIECSQKKVYEELEKWKLEVRKMDLRVGEIPKEPLTSERKVEASFFECFYEIMKREIQSLVRSPVKSFSAICIPAFISILLGGVNFGIAGNLPDPSAADYGAKENQVQGAVTWIISFTGFLAMFNALQPLLNESLVFRKEVHSGTYTVLAYYIAKVIVTLALQLFAVLTFLIISFFMIDCQGSFLVYFAASYLGVMTGIGYGFMISAMVSDIESANLIIPFFLHPQFLAAMGGNQDLRDLVKYITFFLPPSLIVIDEELNGNDPNVNYYYMSLVIHSVVLQIAAFILLYRKAHKPPM